jgi:hypothetical protein
MIVPGGLSDVVYRVRDAGLRWVATRRGLIVPSLLADRAVAEPHAAGPDLVDPPERHLITAVEHVVAHDDDGHPIADAVEHVETTA